MQLLMIIIGFAYICKQSFAKKSVKRFRCEKCDSDICNNCKIKEEVSSSLEGLNI